MQRKQNRILESKFEFKKKMLQNKANCSRKGRRTVTDYRDERVTRLGTGIYCMLYDNMLDMQQELIKSEYLLQHFISNIICMLLNEYLEKLYILKRDLKLKLWFKFKFINIIFKLY